MNLVTNAILNLLKKMRVKEKKKRVLLIDFFCVPRLQFRDDDDDCLEEFFFFSNSISCTRSSGES